MKPRVILDKSIRTLRQNGVGGLMTKASRTLRRNWRRIFFRPYVINRTINGETFPFLIGDVYGEEWYAQEIDYVPELLWIRENLRQGDIVVDCGCHHGIVGVLCARWVGEAGKVIGFEGSPQNVEITRKNIELNGLKNFEVRCEVVGAYSGTAKFLATSNGTVVKNHDSHAIEIPMVCLDDIFTTETPSLIKIDVEGYEKEVLKGCEKILRSLPKLVLEIHCLLFDDPVKEVKDIFGLLPLSRYEVFLQTEFNGELIAYSPDLHTPTVIAGYDGVHLFARPYGKNDRN